MSGALFVMPRPTTAWPTAEALWITAVGWARAAEARFDGAWVATPDGVWEPDRLPRGNAHRPAMGGGAGRRPPWSRLPLGPLRTLLKDLRLARRQSRFALPATAPWTADAMAGLRLVWEHHDLFNDAARPLAAAGVPVVRYVHSPQVWEAAKWGVRRPLWGRALEAREARLLRAADLVPCASEVVRARLLEMGVEPRRVLVSPMGVDPERFSPAADGAVVRRRHGIGDDEVVIGWCGSFRPFHGLEGLIAAFARHVADSTAGGPAVHLLLVGDGAIRGRLEESAAVAGVGGRVVFTGAVAHTDMPAHVRAMDVAVVASEGTGDFHYSPLKVREYAACGRPVVAPAEGELAALGDAGFVSLHRPSDPAALAAALAPLVADPELRRAHGETARAHAVAHWSWAARLDDALAALDRLAAEVPGRGAAT